jgi:hypothetical protein
VYLLAQPPLGADAAAAAEQQHSHHQLRIDRRPGSMAVERCELAAQTAQIEDTVNFSQKMISGNPFIETKFLKEPLLQLCVPPHHPPGPPTVGD